MLLQALTGEPGRPLRRGTVLRCCISFSGATVTALTPEIARQPAMIVVATATMGTHPAPDPRRACVGGAYGGEGICPNAGGVAPAGAGGVADRVRRNFLQAIAGTQ